MLHYHGTPITPRPVLLRLAGRNFCVSYAAPGDLRECHRIGQSVMLDNGAYTFWQQGGTPDWDAYMNWAEPWLDCPTTWAVIPDVIGGGEDENDALLDRWAARGLAKGAPVWHLHESFGRLQRLCDTYERVCFGSSAHYASVGTDLWHRRVIDAFDAIADDGRVPWIHMLRGMKLSGDIYPFGSVDSADVARNHYLPHRDAVEMAERWDSLQCPSRWEPQGVQTRIEEAV